MKPGKASLWLLWSVVTVVIGVYFGCPLLAKDQDRRAFVPGEMSHGHYQIELACEACHTEPFGGTAGLQQACENCHGAELKRARDSHPKSKFTDPRNADRVAQLDARECVTCHVEHKPEQTGPMAVTVPNDYCFKCHQDIAEDRPSHRNLGFDSCASAGCHNFHDNRGLYEDFLVKHLDEPVNLAHATLPVRKPAGSLRQVDGKPVRPLTEQDMDAPKRSAHDPDTLNDWLTTAHARGGVNCGDCHKDSSAGDQGWTDTPDQQVCQDCHEAQAEGFLSGKHGMRLKQKLPPMTPGQARLAMKPKVADKPLDCLSCHGAHRFDARQAAVQGCLGCHNDEHSLAFLTSPHAALWDKEVQGLAPAGTGVSCASCHLPREMHKQHGEDRVIVQHNQNDNLRPNEKMLRSVCLNCHGLGFATDALADPELIRRNFTGRPDVHVPGLEWVRQRKDKTGKK